MNILNRYTVKTLKKNKTRTLVTIVGIILSAAMITAVTTFISSLQSYMLNSVIAIDGSWHGAVYNLSEEERREIEVKDGVANTTALENIGFASLENSQNENKPYIFVAGAEENITDILPVRLTSGVMPAARDEILLPKHMESDAGVKYMLGETITLDIGDRTFDGVTLDNRSVYTPGETIENTVTRTYKIVGFYERPSFEKYEAPGYTVLTMSGESGNCNAYIIMDNAKDIHALLDNTYGEYSSALNTDLLRFSGSSGEDSFNRVLYSLATILIVIIMLASISLIYNAFSISVTERTKQFGLISSIGATKKQLLHSVLFESVFLSLIGIPLGILSGILGIGITLKCTEALFSSMMVVDGIKLSLAVSVPAVVVAAAVALVTVLISAYLPARRALKIPAIEAIRQTGDTNIKVKSLKTSRMTQKLFGFEGMIATKNFKRNKKKYRATVISLFMSIVLFITASSFCAYLTKGTTSVIYNSNYDIRYTLVPNDGNGISRDELLSQLSSVPGVSESGYSYSVSSGVYLKLDESKIAPEYKKYLKETFNNENPWNAFGGAGYVPVTINFIDDSTYRDYIVANNLDINSYLDSDNPSALCYDSFTVYNSEESKYINFKALNGGNVDGQILLQKPLEGYFAGPMNRDAAGGITFDYYKLTENDSIEDEPTVFSQNEVSESYNVKIGPALEAPLMGADNYHSTISIIYPLSAADKILNTAYMAASETKLYFGADNHSAVFDQMIKVLESNQFSTSRLYDYASSMETERAMLTIINVFSYGFIILISLIAAANVFNTISTNLNLRRREFAMLKSIGMTKKGFSKMMNYECLLYGMKGLLYGIPVAIGITFLIFKSMSSGLEMTFFIPWYSIVIAVLSVFIVVFATMIYSISKIRKENTIDALKNENL